MLLYYKHTLHIDQRIMLDVWHVFILRICGVTYSFHHAVTEPCDLYTVRRSPHPTSLDDCKYSAAACACVSPL